MRILRDKLEFVEDINSGNYKNNITCDISKFSCNFHNQYCKEKI